MNFGESVTERYVFPPTDELIRCPYPAYDALRNEQPVYQAPSGEYVVSRYDDIVEVFKNQALFRTPESRTGHPVQMLNEREDPEHKKRRLVVARAIAPARLRQFTPVLRGYCDELIDTFPDSGEVEFIKHFASPLPVMTVSGLVGFEMSDFAWMFEWAKGFEGAALEYQDDDRQAAHHSQTGRLFDYVAQALEDRRVAPRDDVLTEVLELQLSRNPEGLDELTADVTALIGGAVHNTTYMLANTLLLLLQHDEIMQTVRADRSVIPRVLEEAMRNESPVQWQPRFAKEDAEIAGVPIPKGAKLILLLGAANRDPAHFDAPGTFDPERADLRRHIAFGHGSYFCIGAPLARLEGQIALEALLDRYARIELAGEDAWEPLNHVEFHGPSVMHLRLTPA